MSSIGSGSSLYPAPSDLQGGPGWCMYRSRRLVTTYMTNELLTDESFDKYVAALSSDLQALRTGQPKRAVLYETGGDRPFIDAPRRKQIAAVLARHRSVLGAVTAGYAMVTSSTVARGVLTAIFWIDKPPYDTVVVGTLLQGFSWLSGRCPGVDPGEALQAHDAAKREAAERFGG